MDTLGHIAREKGGLELPNLSKLGLSNIREIQGVPVADQASWLIMEKCRKNQLGKDTMTGHWEIMGLYIDTPFRVFPDGFPTRVN